MSTGVSIRARPTARPVFDEAGCPRDPVSGDIYYAPDGLAEARYVFLNGVGGSALWRSAAKPAVAELGFGTGLNFLATWADWRAARGRRDGRLDYVAVEGFPVGLDDLARAHAAFPALAREAAALRESWPPPVGGFHRLWFEGGRVSLTLVLADAETGLASLTGPFDAWYLDGFAPARNPEAWTPEVVRQVARLSRPGTRLATFSAAGAVRRGLETVGFDVAREPGFGGKRHCLRARYRGAAGSGPVAADTPPTVAVIGAGIAGLTAASAIARRGCEVRLFDRGGAGAGASGIPAAMIAPRLQKTDTPRRTFNAQAYLHALRTYATLADGWRPCGVLTLARDGGEEMRQDRLARDLAWPSELMTAIDANAASGRLGSAVGRGGVWHPQAGVVDGAALMRALAVGLEVETASITGVDRMGDGWQLRESGGGVVARAGHVVLAAGPWSASLLGALAPPLRANRGQASIFADGGGPDVGVTFGGYLAPTALGRVLGATFERLPGLDGDDWQAARPADDAANLANLAAHLPGLAAGLGRPAGAWTGLRATTPDYLPYAGEIEPGLYLLAGLGSRGFQAAPLLAEVIADGIVGAPPPVPGPVAAALAPGRFSGRQAASGAATQAT